MCGYFFAILYHTFTWWFKKKWNHPTLVHTNIVHFSNIERSHWFWLILFCRFEKTSNLVFKMVYWTCMKTSQRIYSVVQFDGFGSIYIHYEKSCSSKPHYSITKVQITTHIQLLCNYPLGITTILFCNYSLGNKGINK
jgi:hypothetical protein